MYKLLIYTFGAAILIVLPHIFVTCVLFISPIVIGVVTYVLILVALFILVVAVFPTFNIKLVLNGVIVLDIAVVILPY